MSPYDAVSCLVEPMLLSGQMELFIDNSGSRFRFLDRECGQNDDFLRDFQSLFDKSTTIAGQNCINESYWRDRNFYQQQIRNLLRKCLKESLCILPQDRGVLGRSDQWMLNLKEMESQLVTWKLSGDDFERQHFTKVKDTFKALCGLVIEAVEEPRSSELLTDYLKEEVLSCFRLVNKREGAYEIALQLQEIAANLMEKAPPGGRCVNLMATKTQGEGSNKYGIRMPSTEWSGGERECLMVLTATQMSTADTVFLDEPGHSLHPPQQAQLRRFLETQRRPDQTVVTITHAMEFMSGLSLTSLYHMAFTGIGFTPFKLAVQSKKEGVEEEEEDKGEEEEEEEGKDEEVVTVQPLPNQVLFNQSDMNMLMGPDMRKMFFSTGLYFVEGETDKKVLSALRRYMLDHAWQIRRDSHTHLNLHDLQEAVNILEMDSWDILSLGGCGFAVKAYKAAKALKIPCAIVLDDDTITVKHGTKVEPFTKHNWEKSKLCRELKTHGSSFSEASSLLKEIQSAFEKFKEIEMPKEARTIFERYGFWIWNGDLEGIIFDNKDAREEIKKMEDFMYSVLSNKLNNRLAISDVIPRNEALENFDERIQDPVESVWDELKTELSAARDAKNVAYFNSFEEQRKPVTDELQSTLESALKKLGKIKQRAIQYDKFCQKGTKRSVEPGGGRQKKHFKKSPEDNQPEALVLMDVEENQPTMSVLRDEEGNELAMPIVQEEADHPAILVSPNEGVFLKRVKKQLHDCGGWMKVPEEMMQNIIGACLKDGLKSKNPLAEFLKFMKRHQMQNQNKPEADVPKDIVAMILSDWKSKESS